LIGRGKQQQVSAFDYSMPPVIEASSTKGAFFWRFFKIIRSDLSRKIHKSIFV